MNSNNIKPTFGVNSPNTNSPKRTEAGAAWRRHSKRDNSEFLSIKISFSKERLKNLLNKEGEVVDLGFVAFTNISKGDNIARPDFKIYEDRENGE